MNHLKIIQQISENIPGKHDIKDLDTVHTLREVLM